MSDTSKHLSTLRHSLLIAMPGLEDPYFMHAVVYVHEHNASGATGFIVNKPTNVTVADIMKRVNISHADQHIAARPTLLGGPVAQEQVFFIRRDKRDDSPEAMILAYSKEALEAAVQTDPNQDTLFFLGYASWEAGQLEAEIVENGWLIAPVDYEVLFHLPYMSRYEAAASLIGVDMNNLSSDIGHA